MTNIDRPYDDPISLRLREELRRLRKERGWSIYDLSRAAEVSPSFISMVENGHKAPDPGTLERIARALGMDPGLTRAWMTLRERPKDPQQAMDAAHRLMELVDDDPGPGIAANSMVSAQMAMPREEAVPYTSATPRRVAQERRAGVSIPVVPEGTTLRDGDADLEDPLWLDQRLVPAKTDLRGAFAWRLTRDGIARVRGEYRRGDYVVIAPKAWEPVPAKLAPPRVFAVRIGSRVVLSRVTWGGGQLILLPPDAGSDYVVRAVADEAGLAKRIMGRVVAGARKFAER